MSPFERLLLAVATEGSSKAAKILKAAGVTPQALNTAIENLRQGRTADSANAEAGYDALKKYARDLTEEARKGNLDPVIGRDEGNSPHHSSPVAPNQKTTRC